MAAGNIGRSDYVTGLKQQPISSGGEVVAADVTISLPSTRTPSDVYSLLLLPADHIPVDFIVTSADIDTGTSLTLSFGLLNTAETDLSTTTADGGAAWLASSTVGQAGGLARPTTAVMSTVENAQTNRVFGVKVILAGSATAGNITVTLLYRRSRYNA